MILVIVFCTKKQNVFKDENHHHHDDPPPDADRRIPLQGVQRGGVDHDGRRDGGELSPDPLQRHRPKELLRHRGEEEGLRPGEEDRHQSEERGACKFRTAVDQKLETHRQGVMQKKFYFSGGK